MAACALQHRLILCTFCSLFLKNQLRCLPAVGSSLDLCCLQKRHFTTLDNILATGDPDGKFPNIQKIQQLDGLGHLSHICDMRSIDDSTVYRLNAEKTLEWLKKKVSKVVTKLKEMPEIYAGSGSRVSSFVQSHNKAASSKEDSEYIRYAVGLVSEYLPPEWTDRMKDEFKEHFDKEVHDEPVSKKAKRGSQSEECDDDYTKFNTKKTLEVEKPKKMTVAERALAKVDKTGMKTMASFFKPLSKKKST
eukprot:m.248338 g.248338  ORF g.248338 m.248338 type:complete len:248 (+) comp40287_c0_seq24:269-1012(+)